MYVLATMVCAGAVSVAYGFLHSLVFDAAWAELIGLVVLLASTGLAIWARLALGSMWSVGPEVGGDRSLRTRGPYGVTRHPIYTGFLGMIIGTMLLAGGHELIALAVVGLILFEVKIYQEKRLMVATFPDEYADYRRRVPQIVPGLQPLRWHDRQPKPVKVDHARTRPRQDKGWHMANDNPEAMAETLAKLDKLGK